MAEVGEDHLIGNLLLDAFDSRGAFRYLWPSRLRGRTIAETAERLYQLMVPQPNGEKWDETAVADLAACYWRGNKEEPVGRVRHGDP